MDKSLVAKLTRNFEDYVHNENGIEYWMARDIQKLLGYEQWRNFLNVIDKAKIACKTSSHMVDDHFADVSTMIEVGKGAERQHDDMKLTRLACYLIAQNGDPRKETIAFAQSYFALQTRKQELLEERINMIERLNARQKLVKTEKELSETLYQHGVDDQGFARIRSKGDQALFGGYTTQEMKDKIGVPKTRPLADFLPTITIKAKDFANEITHFNVKREDLRGENQITDEHVKNNKDVRGVLLKSDIYPENLPPEEDIKKLERRIERENKNLTKTATTLMEKKCNLE